MSRVAFAASRWRASSLAATPALALTLEVTHAGPSVVGEAHAFTATVTGANGAVTLRVEVRRRRRLPAGRRRRRPTPSRRPASTTSTWSRPTPPAPSASAFFQHLVHHPLTREAPDVVDVDRLRRRAEPRLRRSTRTTTPSRRSTPDKLQKLAELAVYRRPESLALTPEGKLWVVHQDDYAVAVVDPDRFVIERGFRLPYASQPVGVAMSPTGDAAYVSLMAVGKLLKLDPRTGDVIGEVQVGPRPRGIAVSHDGKDVYVTRFISPDTGGEVVKVDAAAMKVATRIVLALDAETVDSDLQARGLPNYLFSVALTPDGRQAWVPGKKDNIVRGKLRDGRDLTHDTTVRPLAAVIDTQAAQEIYANRVDLDDRSQPVHVEFSPFGNFAILTLAGSNRVEIRDVNRPTAGVLGDRATWGRSRAPPVLAPDGRLFVQGALSRNVLVYDLSAMLKDFAQVDAGAGRRHPDRRQREAAGPGARRKEDLSRRRGHAHGVRGLPELRRLPLRGRSTTAASTISAPAARACATRRRCSAARGPGRAASTGPAPSTRCRTSSTRSATCSTGAGFLPDDVFHVGTRDQPLGDAKAGLSPELDALAAYVASLDHVNPSPYRNPDGSLTRGRRRRQGAVRASSAATSATAGRSSPTARAACCTTSAPSRRCPARARAAPCSASTRRPCSASGRRRPTFTTARRRRCATCSPRRTRPICTATSARCRRSRSTSWSPISCRSTASSPCVPCPFDPPRGRADGRRDLGRRRAARPAAARRRRLRLRRCNQRSLVRRRACRSWACFAWRSLRRRRRVRGAARDGRRCWRCRC